MQPPSIDQYNADHQAFVDFTNKSLADKNALIAQQNATQQGLYDQYKTAIANQTKLPDLFNQLSTQLDIPSLSGVVQGYKDQAYKTQGLLDRLDTDVTARTQGTLTSEGARDAIIGHEGADLRTQLGAIGNGMAPFSDRLNSAQGTLAAEMPLYVQQQDKELDPLKLQINQINDLFAREISGFDTNTQLQLNSLMDQLARDRTLSDREWQQAADLAKQQQQYDLALRNANAAAAASSGSGAGYIGGGGGSSAPASGGSNSASIAQQASAGVAGLLGSRSVSRWSSEIQAITKSAAYGNQIDQAKLQIINRTMPGILQSSSAGGGYLLNLNYLKNLAANHVNGWY